MIIAVDSSELLKIRDTLVQAGEYFQNRDRMNAAVHGASTVRFSPVTSNVLAAEERIKNIFDEANFDPHAETVENVP